MLPTIHEALIQPVLEGWAVAIPIIASAISGYMQSRAQKRARDRKSGPLSDAAISDSANQYFPGLFSSKGTWNPEAMANPIQTRAAGGPVSPGTPYLVGEKGPEVITPSAPGTVIPNQGQQTQPPTNTPPPPQTSVSTPPPATTPPAIEPPATVAPTLPGNTQPTGQPPTVRPGTPSSNPPASTDPTSPSATVAPSNPDPTPGSVTTTRPETAGGLVVQHMMDYLTDPGRISPAAYERKQEQANQGYNLAVRSIGGTISSAGINPNSGFGMMMAQSAALNTMKLRNEANRDFTMASEQLKREDVKTATDSYINFLHTIFGLGAERVNSVLDQNVEGPARAVGIAGQTVGDYFANKGTAQTQPVPAASTPPTIGPRS